MLVMLNICFIKPFFHVYSGVFVYFICMNTFYITNVEFCMYVCLTGAYLKQVGSGSIY